MAKMVQSDLDDWKVRIDTGKSTLVLFAFVQALTEIGDPMALPISLLARHGKVGVSNRWMGAYNTLSRQSTYAGETGVAGSIDIEWYNKTKQDSPFHRSDDVKHSFIIWLAVTWLDADEETRKRWLWTTTAGATERPDVEVSKKWLEDYAKARGSSYEYLIRGLNGTDLREEDESEKLGDFESRDDACWSHYAVVKGQAISDYSSPFTCC